MINNLNFSLDNIGESKNDTILTSHLIDQWDTLWNEAMGGNFNVDLCKELLADTFRLFYFYHKNSSDVIPKFLIDLILTVKDFSENFYEVVFSNEAEVCMYIAEALLDVIKGYPNIPSDHEMPDEKTLAKTIIVRVGESCFYEIDIQNFDITPIVADLELRQKEMDDMPS